MSTPPPRREPLVERLVACSDRRAANRLARTHAGSVGPETVAALEDRFRAAVRDDPRRAGAVVRAAGAVAAVDRGDLSAAAWRGMAAVLDHVLGRSEDALDHLEVAVSHAGRAEAWLRAGDLERVRVDVLGSIGRDREALQAATRARRAYRKSGGADAARRGALALNVGHLHHRTDRHSKALESYAEALRAYRRAGDPLRIALAIYNRANVHASLDRIEHARRGYLEARSVFERHARAVLVARADRALAELDRLEGRLDPALFRLAEVRAIRDEIGDRLGVAHTDLESAEVLLRLNRADEAARAAEAARGVFVAAARHARVAACERVLASAELRRGRPAAAGRRFASAERRFKADGNDVAAAGAAIGRARALRAQGRLAVAERVASAAARVLRERPSSRGRALVVAAEAALDDGRRVAAMRRLREALRISRRCGDGRVEFAALLALARSESLAGRPDREYRRLRSAERCVERLRAGVTAEESRLAFALDKSVVYERLIRNRLDRGDAASVRQALVFAERGKSRILAERLAAGGEVARRHAAGEGRALLARLRRIDRELALAESRIEAGGPGSGIRSGGAARIRALSVDRTEVLARLSRVAPGAASLVGARPPDPWSIVEALGPDEMVLEYVEADGAFHLFVVERDRLRAFPALCDVREIEATLDLLRFQLGKGVLGDDHANRFAPYLRESLRRHHEALYDRLIAPVDGEIDGRSLRIVPHGSLHGLPFHALERGGRCIVDRCTVSYAPSLTVLGLLHRSEAGRRLAPLVLGVPDGAAPEIEAEVEAVRAHLGDARVYRGRSATSETLFRDDGRPEVLHVACHGFYAEDGGFVGGLRLGDAWVTLPELYSLPRTADLVVLSGCETGRGTVYSGDEWVGLVRGFLQAGARAVVASLWEVHDATAVATMDAFYGELAAGVPVGRALARAQRSARGRDDYPLHWAPFVVVGDPGYRLRRRKVA